MRRTNKKVAHEPHRDAIIAAIRDLQDAEKRVWQQEQEEAQKKADRRVTFWTLGFIVAAYLIMWAQGVM